MENGADPVLPVLVVGAGPVGLTVAALLARRGIRSLLIERHSTPYGRPRAVHVDDEVMRILQDAGIAGEFAAVSRPAAGLRLLDADHRVLAEFRRDRLVGEHGHPQASLFDQPDLERLLRANLDRRPEVDVRAGTELVDLRWDGGGVEATIRPTGSGVAETIRARAVLGCDGANSTVRELMGARMRDLGFEERWLVLDVRVGAPLEVWDGVEQVCDPRRAATFMRVGPDRYRWEFRMHPGETVAGLTGPKELAALIGPWLKGEPVTAIAVRRAVEYTFRAQVADRWRAGNVLLLGDAAHLTPPFVGQGLGSGLRDAHNLAWKLAAVLTGDADPDLLDTYQTEREPHARALIRLAITAGWAMTGGQGRAAAIRRLALQIFCRLPGATTLMLNSTSPPLRAGPLVRSNRLRGPVHLPGLRSLPGTLCPQPWVGVRDAEGIWTRSRLDDVLGSGFVRLGLSPAVTESAGHPVTEVTEIRSPELVRWLTRARCSAVLLRPDRVVLATARAHRPGRLPAGSSATVISLSGHVGSPGWPAG